MVLFCMHNLCDLCMKSENSVVIGRFLVFAMIAAKAMQINRMEAFDLWHKSFP